MRLLVIGMPLPNQRIDNYSFFSAPSFFDYDALVIEPAAVAQVIGEVISGGTLHSTAADEPVVNAAAPGLNVGLAAMLRRRRQETEMLLERGGTVAVFARPNQPLPFIAGFPGADQYSWLPEPFGFAYAEPYLMPAFGTQVVLTDTASSMAPFITGFERWFHYRAYFAEHLPAFATVAQVFARSIGGAAVGVRIPFGRGQILFLPAMFEIPAGDPRFNLASTLLDTMTQSVHAALEEDEPEWIADESMPGLEPLALTRERAAHDREQAIERYAEADSKYNEVVRFRRLLWQEGRYGLDPVVREAFQLLGFQLTIDVDSPAVLDADGQTAFLEVEGSKEAVMEWPYFRLQKRLERDLLQTRQPKKGVIVVNGQRLQRLAERDAPYSDALRIASENYRYALLRSDQLLELVREAQRRPEPESLQRLRALIFAMVGDALPDGFPAAAETAGAVEAPPTDPA